MKRAVLYARVSGDDRGNDGRNLAGQLDMCREHARTKGWQITAELAEDDRGASGASFELPQLNKALEMATARAFDMLVVREIDRLSRRLAKQLVVEEEFNKCGVQIEYVLGDYPDTPEGALMKNVRAVIAEYERLKIIERMDRGRRLKINSGSVLAYGRPPYGYKLVQDNGKHLLEIHEPEAKIIRQIFEWYADESQSLAIRGITRKLTELGVPTYFDLHPEPNRKGSGYGQWNTGTVCHILRNKTYAGVWYFGKRNASGINPTENWLSVDVPPIISQAMWEAAQTKMDENKRHLRRKTKYPFLLTKRLYCGDCGCRIYTEARKIGEKLYLYYKCHSYRNVRNCNTRKGYPAKWLDAEVWNWVRGILSDPSSLEKGMARFKTAQEKEAKGDGKVFYQASFP